MAANTLLPVSSGHLSAALLKIAREISANFICNKISKLNMKFGEFIITAVFPREEGNERQARKKISRLTIFLVKCILIPSMK